jgi:hypothetical protein
MQVKSLTFSVAETAIMSPTWAVAELILSVGETGTLVPAGTRTCTVFSGGVAVGCGPTIWALTIGAWLTTAAKIAAVIMAERKRIIHLFQEALRA